jgi:hypothetical protein
LEERAIRRALDECFGANSVQPEPWALAGRAEALRLGALQIRNQSLRPWSETRLNHFTRFGAEPRMGRGDAK